MFGSNDILNKIPTIKKLVYTLVLTFLLFFLFLGCSKGDSPVKVVDTSLSLKVNNNYNGTLIYTRLNVRPVVEFTFTETVDNGTVNSSHGSLAQLVRASRLYREGRLEFLYF